MAVDSVFEVLVDNDALRAIDIRMDADAAGKIARTFHNALLIGIEDGTGIVAIEGKERERFIPVARGRVEWLGDGKLQASSGHGAFGRALLVEVRSLPYPQGVERTFGDRVLLEREGICVYEEVIGPGQVRLMHNHGPRLVLCLTDLFTKNRLPEDKKTEVRRPRGTVVYNSAVVTHEVMNAGDEPFWCVLVEHP